MISYLKGEVVVKEADYVILNVNGVGYLVHYKRDVTSRELSLFITQKFSDYGVTLYGFDSLEEKKVFDFILSLNVLGPKLASDLIYQLNISSFDQLNELSEDALIKINGIGKNLANRILLALKLKTGKRSLSSQRKSGSKEVLGKYIDVIQTLESLGFSRKELINFIELNLKQMAQMSSNDEILLYIVRGMASKNLDALLK